MTLTKKKNLDLKLSEKEKTLVAAALQLEKPWKDKNTKNIRNKIRDFHLKLTDDLCCYCQQNFHGEFKLVIDPEHILPASIYSHYSFSIWNLSVACKRCNMLIKKARTDFLDKSHPNEQESEHYKFIHPNFDEYDEHLELNQVQKGKKRIVKYLVCSKSKGEFTRKYFKLEELEMNNFNRSQGIETVTQDSEITMAVRSLASKNNIE
ncbi:hypothetical protein D3C78_56580 [compost metagenome]